MPTSRKDQLKNQYFNPEENLEKIPLFMVESMICINFQNIKTIFSLPPLSKTIVDWNLIVSVLQRPTHLRLG